jgi:enoyl-CoA hydratase/carnithine racemase
MNDFRHIIVEKAEDEKISIISLNRPSKLNSFNNAMFEELKMAADILDKDPFTRVIIIDGGSSRIFTAGLDRKS